MAITALAPAISRSKQKVIERSSEVALRLVPKIDTDKRADQKVFILFLTGIGIMGLVSLLFINTLLAQDAFTLSNLKIEAKAVADQRDAINRSIDSHAAPDSLATKAEALGMKPSETPIFLNLSPTGEVTRG